MASANGRVRLHVLIEAVELEEGAIIEDIAFSTVTAQERGT